MKQIIATILLLLSLQPAAGAQTHQAGANGFPFARFPIGKGQLGPVKIGMTIAEAEQQFGGLTRKRDEATSFGFDGGSPAYLYYAGDKVILGLITKLDTDTIMFIIAADRRFNTTNGLHPNSTVKALTTKYPGLKINWDEMNNWEFFQDEKNEWDFVFMTDQKDRIAVYQDINLPATPRRLTVKTDWITIR